MTPAHRRAWTLPQMVIAVGFGLRLIEYCRNNPLWGDEAMLALSIASRPFRQLLPPLPYGQVAPVPFLWAERLQVQLFGVNEWALRLLPLIAGCALCLALAVVAQRVLRAQEALIALVLVAFSQTLIRYSAEVKPYIGDALVAVLLVGTVAALMRRMDDTKCWFGLGLAGAAAILVSLPSAFVCAGAGTALALHGLRDKRGEHLPRVFLLGIFWLLVFAGTYSQLYQAAASSPYMRSFWERAFLVPGSPLLLARSRMAVQEVLWPVDPGTALLGLGTVTAGFILLGGAGLWRRGQGAFTVLLLLPALLPFAASALGVYPIASRLMLFAVPLLMMLAAVGIITLGELVHRLVPSVQVRWFAASLLLPTICSTLTWLVLYDRDQQMRLVVQDLTSRWREGDAVYVYHRVIPAWLFYSTNWNRPDTRQLAWAMRVSGPGGLAHENGPTRGPRTIDEGSGLAYAYRKGEVLLGTASGVQGRPMFGYQPKRPDPGWAEGESHRICTAAHPRAWIVSGNAYEDEERLRNILLGAVRRTGGQLIYQSSPSRAGLYLTQFPGMGDGCAGGSTP